MWAIGAIGAVLGLALVVRAVPSGTKAITALVGTGTIVLVTFLALVTVSAGGAGEATHGFSHAQLEADRVMTEQMGVSVGAGMDTVMSVDGLLERSTSDAYVRALEEHVSQFDRMLGRIP